MMYEHHFWTGQHDVHGLADKNTVYIAHDDAKVHVTDSAFVVAFDNATVRVYGNSIVYACENSNVTMLGGGCVIATDNADVLLMGNGLVFGTGESVIYTTVGKKRIFTYGDSHIISRDLEEDA